MLYLFWEALRGVARDEPRATIGYVEFFEHPQETGDADLSGEEPGRIVCEDVVGVMACST
jgi:hypothetical protein